MSGKGEEQDFKIRRGMKGGFGGAMKEGVGVGFGWWEGRLWAMGGVTSCWEGGGGPAHCCWGGGGACPAAAAASAKLMSIIAVMTN